MRPPFSFPRKKTGVARPKERRSPLQASSSKNCNACRIGCLPSSVSKRLDYLLSSLSLCLRFATLTQFPPTSDFRCFVFACQGSIASRAAIFAPSVDGDYTAPEQDSRAAADDRSRGKSYSSFNAATPRYGQCNRQALQLFELLACNGKTFLLGDLKGAILFHKKRMAPF